MTKLTGILASALGASLLFNICLVVRRGPGPEPVPRSSSERPAGPATLQPRAMKAVDLSAVLAELQELRHEVRQLRASGGDSAAGRIPAPQPAARIDPELSGILADHRALRELWETMEQLAELRVSVGPLKCRELIVRATTECLRLPRTAFEAAIPQMLDDLARARHALESVAETAEVDSDGMDEQSGAAASEADARYQGLRRAALARIEGLLDSSPRHQLFRERLESWSDHVAQVE